MENNTNGTTTPSDKDFFSPNNENLHKYIYRHDQQFGDKEKADKISELRGKLEQKKNNKKRTSKSSGTVIR